MGDRTSASARVLLVEGEVSLRSVLRDMLEEAGYEVLAAASLADAGRLLAAEAVDVVLDDVDMPENRGFQLLDLLRREHPRLPVMLMTADATPGGARRAAQLGAMGYLSKPVHGLMYLAALERVLRSSGHSTTG